MATLGVPRLLQRLTVVSIGFREFFSCTYTLSSQSHSSLCNETILHAQSQRYCRRGIAEEVLQESEQWRALVSLQALRPR